MRGGSGANRMSSMEEWRAVDGHPRYEVSDMGRVRSSCKGPNRLLRGGLTTGGYRNVAICFGGRMKTYYVHRLVCAAFHGAPVGARAEVAHFDGDRLNNRSNNLRWATTKENQADRVRHNTHTRGASNGNATLSEGMVHEIRRRHVGGAVTHRSTACEFGVHRSTVSDIVSGRTWAHLEYIT